MLLQCIRIGIRPLLGRELFAGICPEITVMQIQQIAVTQLFTGRSQCHQLGEIAGTGTVRLAVLTVRIVPETDAQRVGTIFFQDFQCIPLSAFVIKPCTESGLFRQSRYIHTFDKFFHITPITPIIPLYLALNGASGNTFHIELLHDDKQCRDGNGYQYTTCAELTKVSVDQALIQHVVQTDGNGPLRRNTGI